MTVRRVDICTAAAVRRAAGERRVPPWTSKPGEESSPRKNDNKIREFRYQAFGFGKALSFKHGNVWAKIDRTAVEMGNEVAAIRFIF